MLKRFIGGVLAWIMVINMAIILLPEQSVYAFNNYQVKAIVDTTIRAEPYDKTKVLKNVKKGDVITVIGEVTNKYGNLWYKVEGNGYIFNEKVQKITTVKPMLTPMTVPANYQVKVNVNTTVRAEPYDKTKVLKDVKKGDVFDVIGEVTNGYGNLWYRLKGSGYIFSEKVDKVDQNKPTLTPSYVPPSQPNTQNSTSNKNNTTSASSNNNTSSGGKTQSTGSSSSKKEEHVHTYYEIGYEKAHPHLVLYECSTCDSGGKCGPETKKVSSCDECNGHEHEYELVGFLRSHPNHYPKYECYCGKNYYDEDDARKLLECEECYPTQVSCNFVDSGRRLKEHPHYLIEICEDCGEERLNRNSTGKYSKCDICNNPFDSAYGGYPDLHGRVYDIASGDYFKMSSSQRNALYDYSEEMHANLDICGLTPGIPGMVCDGINVLYYLVEGDLMGAGISGVAFIPFLGIMSKSGKIYNKPGMLMIDMTADNAKDFVKVVESTTVDLFEGLSDYSRNVIKYSNYGDDAAEVLAKIINSDSIELYEAFYDGKLLVNSKYTGTIESPMGLIYDNGSREGHRLVHIIKRHSSNYMNESTASNFFDVIDDEDIFYMIDDAFTDGNLLAYGEINGKNTYFLETPYVIGTQGEDILCLVLEKDGKKVISAYPVHEVPQTVKYQK